MPQALSPFTLPLCSARGSNSYLHFPLYLVEKTSRATPCQIILSYTVERPKLYTGPISEQPSNHAVMAIFFLSWTQLTTKLTVVDWLVANPFYTFTPYTNCSRSSNCWGCSSATECPCHADTDDNRVKFCVFPCRRSRVCKCCCCSSLPHRRTSAKWKHSSITGRLVHPKVVVLAENVSCTV